MANPGFSAPDLTPRQIEKTREGKRPWPRNRDINFDIDSQVEPEQPK